MNKLCLKTDSKIFNVIIERELNIGTTFFIDGKKFTVIDWDTKHLNKDVGSLINTSVFNTIEFSFVKNESVLKTSALFKLKQQIINSYFNLNINGIDYLLCFNDKLDSGLSNITINNMDIDNLESALNLKLSQCEIDYIMEKIEYISTLWRSSLLDSVLRTKAQVEEYIFNDGYARKIVSEKQFKEVTNFIFKNQCNLMWALLPTKKVIDIY